MGYTSVENDGQRRYGKGLKNALMCQSHDIPCKSDREGEGQEVGRVRGKGSNNTNRYNTAKEEVSHAHNSLITNLQGIMIGIAVRVHLLK